MFKKISKFKTGGVHKYINFRSFENYRVHYYKNSLGQLVFPKYEILDNVNAAYLDFFQKITTVIDKISPYKIKLVKGNTQKWFDGEVLEKLNSRDFIRNLKNLDSKLIESYLTKRNMKT